MVEKFNNSKGPRFSDMPLMVDGATQGPVVQS